MSILSVLIGQAKNPEGGIGKTMVSIMNLAHKNITKWGLSQIQISKNATILDIGCGGGSTLSLLSKVASKGQLIGLDYSHDALKVARKRNRTSISDGRVSLMHGNVMNLPFESGKFQIVTAVQSHYFWPDMKKSVKEIDRVLQAGGQMMILAENYKMNYHMTSYETPLKLKTLLLEQGFESVTIKEHNKWTCIISRKCY